MISGTTAWARFAVDVDLALVNGIVITYASRVGDVLLQKRYPDDTEYRDGMIWLPLTQEDTVKLRSRGDIVLVELQFNLVSGAVAKSDIKTVCASDTLSTEYVDGSAPDDSQRDGGVIGVTLDDVIVVQTEGTGGITEESDPTVPDWAKQPEKPKYTASEVGALPANTKIPAKTSDLTNDSGFITKAAADLVNYYKKSETYTRDEINERISVIPKFGISVVDTLPISGISETTIYLVKSGAGSDLYTEYIYTNGMWEILGSQRVDLTGYATESWVNVKLAEYLLRSELQAAIDDALAQAKESGEFKGDKGDKGDTGDTGAQGPQGEQGIQGEKGETGAAGANGISATHSWNGTVLTVTSASGTSSADLKGDKGDKGDTGDKGDKGDTGATGPAGSDASVTSENIENALGYTPADADEVSQLSEAIDDKLPKNQGAANVGKILVVGSDGKLTLTDMPEASGDVVGTLDESNNILLTGNLADGTYTLKYKLSDGTYADAGTLTVSQIVAPKYTNILTSGKYDIQLNKRWSASSKAYSACNGMIAFKIPVADAQGKTIRFKGFTPNLQATSNAPNWYLLDSGNARLSFLAGTTGGNGNVWDSSHLTSENGIYSLPVNDTTFPNISSGAWIAINLAVNQSAAITTLPDTLIMTIGEEIE